MLSFFVLSNKYPSVERRHLRLRSQRAHRGKDSKLGNPVVDDIELVIESQVMVLNVMVCCGLLLYGFLDGMDGMDGIDGPTCACKVHIWQNIFTQLKTLIQ